MIRMTSKFFQYKWNEKAGAWVGRFEEPMADSPAFVMIPDPSCSKPGFPAWVGAVVPDSAVHELLANPTRRALEAAAIQLCNWHDFDHYMTEEGLCWPAQAVGHPLHDTAFAMIDAEGRDFTIIPEAEPLEVLELA